MGSNPIPSATNPMNKKLASLLLLSPSLGFLAGVALYSLGVPSGPSGEHLLKELNQNQAFSLLSPALLLGTAALALASSVAAQLAVRARFDGGELVTSLRLRPQLSHLTIAATSLTVLAVFVTYVLAENWQCLVGDKLTC